VNNKTVIECDVLIIGGGSAGSMAGIRAKELNPDCKVIIMEKGDAKYSGCIARGMDALNIVAVPGVSTPELYVESNSIACDGIMDEPVNYKMAERSWGMMQKLISWGVCFPTDENGEYDILQVHPKGKFCVTMKEPNLKVIIHKRAIDSGVRFLNRTMGIQVLTQDGRVTGVIGLNVRTGEMIVVRAKSVILSSGGVARFGLPNSGHLYGVYDYPGNTGDGYMMAYRAGAEVSGFEYTMVLYITKDINAPLLYIALTRGGHVLNAHNERRDKNYPSLKTLFHEHMFERSGPMRIELKHLPENKIKEIENLLFTTERPACERFHQGRDNDFRTGEIELWPTEVLLCGGHGLTGVRINENAETNIPGLYSAGDTALCARGHLTGAFVIGEVAAEAAVEYTANRNHQKIDNTPITAFLNHCEKRMEMRSDVSIDEFEFKIRRIIGDYIQPPKNEYKLNRALWWMDRFREEMHTVPNISSTRDLFKSFEIDNIIDCATLSAIASKERKETRWSPWHFRTDYPEQDDTNWLKHIVLSQGSELGQVNVEYKEIIKMNQ